MADLPEQYTIESLDQVRTLADPLRLRIMDRLIRQAYTVTQLGAELEEAPAKIHYHVRELDRVGLVKLVETREKGGILEKYYRAVAKSVTMSPTLALTAPLDETAAVIREFLAQIARDTLNALATESRNPRGQLVLTTTLAWMTPDEFREVIARVQEVVRPYEERRQLAEEREYQFYLLAFPVESARPAAGSPAAPPAPTPPPTPAPPPTPPTPTPRIRRMIVVGAVSVTRAELERAVASGERIDITAFGVCDIAADVTPELAERAIRRFDHHGVLRAAPDVREVLRAKRP